MKYKENNDKTDVMCKSPSKARVLDEVGVGAPQTDKGFLFCRREILGLFSSQERLLTQVWLGLQVLVQFQI